MNGNKAYRQIGAASSNPHTKQGGLTLIELLVAISVLAFVAVLGWRGLDSIVRARVALTDDLEQTRGMQLAFAQMQNDFAKIATESSVPDRVPLTIDRDRVILIRKVYAENQPSRLQVVTYQVKNSVLTRRESEATRDLTELDKIWSAAETDSGTGQDVALQSGVAAMTMRLWDANGWGAPNTNPGASATSNATSTKPGAPPSVGVPTPGTPPQISKQSTPTGLQVALQLQGRETSMLKVFLLGAV